MLWRDASAPGPSDPLYCPPCIISGLGDAVPGSPSWSCPLALAPHTHSLWNDLAVPGVGGPEAAPRGGQCSVVGLVVTPQGSSPLLAACVWPAYLSEPQLSIRQMDLDLGPCWVLGGGSPICSDGPSSEARSVARGTLFLLPGVGWGAGLKGWTAGIPKWRGWLGRQTWKGGRPRPLGGE